MVGVARGIRGQTHWNHTHRKLVNLITWTTALSNSMKLSHALWGHPRLAGHGGQAWQNVVHWRRECKPLQYSCLENPRNSMKRRLLLGRKVMIYLDSIFKSRDITLPTKVRLVKAMVFPVVMYGCENWTVKKAERWRIDAFKLWC